MKNWLYLIFGTLCITLLLSWYYRAQEGFTPREIASLIDPKIAGHDPILSDAEKRRIQPLFDQPFFYLAKGCQFYVFESKDHQYVLKFFKHKHLRPLDWLKIVPIGSEKWREGIIDKRDERIQKLIISCRIAYQYLQDESGIVTAHLDKSLVWHQKVILLDKLGFSHKISLDDHEFILQRKARSLLEVFKEIKDPHEIEERVEKLAELVRKRAQKGVEDKDKAFAQNVGFIGTEACFLDLGQLCLMEKPPSSEEIQKEVAFRMLELEDFVKRNFPKKMY